MKASIRLFLISSLLACLGPTGISATDIARPAESIAVDSGESSLYRGPDGTLYLTWSGPGGRADERALKFATLAPAASAWSAPRTIVSTPLLMENWADFATLTVATDGALWAQWYQQREGDAGGYSGWFSRSKDGGATWTQPAPLGNEFVSLAPLSGGRVLAVWLESTRKRDPNAPRPLKDPQASYTPSMCLNATLLAPDGSALRSWTVDPDVCTCCQTTLASLPGDRVLVAYRGHTPDETRDNHIALFNGTGWETPSTLHDDGWKIAACPVNGPAADATGEHVAAAWFTAAEGTARVQAKLSADGGRTFGPPIALDLGRPIGRIDLVSLADGTFLVSWLESRSAQNSAGLYVRRIFPDGALSAPHLVAATSAARASGFARMAARRGDDLPVAITWTSVGAVPAGGNKPATLVHTTQISAATLPRLNGSFVAVTRGDNVQFLELCSATEVADRGDH